MTPKEKAQDLWLKYYELLPDGIYSTQAAKIEAKNYALIAVDEIIEVHSQLEGGFDTIDWLNLSVYSAVGYSLEYWQDVKTEIEKL
jgi:hypothetical protein